MNAPVRAVVTCIVCSVAAAAFAASAGEPVQANTKPAAVSRQLVLPGTGLGVEPGTFAAKLEPADTARAHLKAIAAWLSSEFGLPRIDERPAITFASSHRLIGLRYRDAPSDRWSGAHLNAPGERPDIVAVYDDEARTIYLPEGWSGKTPGETSVLVHEMVHHIQNMAGLKFACPEEREKMAFEAQERWLGLFSSDLELEFGLDSFTVLARTHCLY